MAVDVHPGLVPARPDLGLLSVPQGLERSRLRGETDAWLSSCVRRCWWRSWSCRGVVETTRAWQTWRQEFQIRSCAGCPRHSPRMQLRVGTCPTCYRLPARTRHVPCTVPPSSKSWTTSGTRLHRRVGHRSSTTSPTMCDTLAQNFNVAGRQKTEERHASSIVPGVSRESILESAAAFLENFEVECRASSLLTCNCMLEAFVVYGETAGGLRHF